MGGRERLPHGHGRACVHNPHSKRVFCLSLAVEEFPLQGGRGGGAVRRGAPTPPTCRLCMHECLPTKSASTRLCPRPSGGLRPAEASRVWECRCVIRTLQRAPELRFGACLWLGAIDRRGASQRSRRSSDKRPLLRGGRAPIPIPVSGLGRRGHRGGPAPSHQARIQALQRPRQSGRRRANAAAPWWPLGR